MYMPGFRVILATLCGATTAMRFTAMPLTHSNDKTGGATQPCGSVVSMAAVGHSLKLELDRRPTMRMPTTTFGQYNTDTNHSPTVLSAELPRLMLYFAHAPPSSDVHERPWASRGTQGRP
eukprot:7507175-Pyramimonas_sp.AAC.2